MLFTWKYLKGLLNKADYSNSAMVAWPVIYPASMLPPKNPHVTIYYIEDVTKNPEWKDAIIEAVRATDFAVFPMVQVKQLSMFGENKDFPVLEVENAFLHRYHAELGRQLDARGVEYDTRFPEYKPHVTMSPEGFKSGIYPRQFLLTPVTLWWRNEKVRIF